MNIIDKIKVIRILIPDAKFNVVNSEEFIWLDDKPQPTDEEIEAKIKELEEEEKIKEKYDSCKNYIYKYYPQDKQNSDLSDKIYYENILKAKGIENLENDIITRVKDFFAGKTLEEVVEDISDEDKEAYLQLLKANIRVTWVQMCKDELKKAIDEKREPVYPKYPL